MNYLKLWRPQQWLKNIFLLAGIIFAQQFLIPAQVLRALLGLMIFCIASGGIYTINDVWDREADRHHPRKRHRLIASGQISPGAAVIWGIFSLVVAFLLSLMLPLPFTLTVVAYELLMLLYTFILKTVVIADVLVIAIGFVMRAYAGAAVVEVRFSHWLLMPII